MGSTARRIARNTGWLYAKMGITMFISLWTTRLVLSGLGQSDFGIFNLVGGMIAMLGFLNAAMAAATQRFMSYSQGEGDSEKQKTIFNVSVVLHLLISLIAGFLLLISGFVFFSYVLKIPDGRQTAAMIVYGSLIVSTMFTVMTVPYDALMNAHENMKYYAVVGIFESLLKLTVAFIVLKTSSDKLIVYGVLMACIPLITMTLMRVYCRSHYPECVVAPKIYCKKDIFKEMTSFAGWTFVSTATTMLGAYGMGIVLNYFFGTVMNAAHGIATQLNGQVMAFSNNLMKAVNPIIAKSEGSGNREKMISVSFTGCKLAFFMIAIFAVPLIIEARYVLDIWLNGIVPDHAVIFTQLILARSALEQMTSALYTAISAEGRIKSMQLWTSVLAVLVIIASILAFMLGGDAAWIYVMYLVVFAFGMTLVKLVIMHRNCGMEYWPFLRDVIIPMALVTFLSCAAGLIPHCLMSEGVVRLVAVTVSSVSVFLLTAFMLGLTSDERTEFKSLARSIIKRG